MISADLHLHSNVSDGLGSPELIVRRSYSMNIDIISITDHNTFEGSSRAIEYVHYKKLPIVILPGAEMRVKKTGDFLLYCPQPLNVRGPYNSLEELIAVSINNSCIIIPAHPLNIIMYGPGIIAFDSKFETIECFNGWTLPHINYLTYRLAKIHNKRCLASSDAHVPTQVGLFLTLFKAWEISSPHEAFELLIKNVEVSFKMKYSIRSTLDRLSWAVYRRVVRNEG